MPHLTLNQAITPSIESKIETNYKSKTWGKDTYMTKEVDDDEIKLSKINYDKVYVQTPDILTRIARTENYLINKGKFNPSLFKINTPLFIVPQLHDQPIQQGIPVQQLYNDVDIDRVFDDELYNDQYNDIDNARADMVHQRQEGINN